MKFNKKGMTIVELLMAMVVAAILVGTVALTLNACFEAYISGEKEITALKFLDEIGNQIIYGDYTVDGVHDAMEILTCGTKFIKYVPLWKDTTHRPPYLEGEEFVVEKPYKIGSGAPLGEIMQLSDDKQIEYFKNVQIKYEYDEETGELKVVFLEPIPRWSRVQLVYWPDADKDESAAVTIQWSPETGRISQFYNKNVREIKARGIVGLKVLNFEFHYFDNANNEIKPDGTGLIPKNQLVSITGVELDLSTQFEDLSRKIPIFVNLRNTRSSGAPIPIRQGTEIRVPGSREVDIFSIANITGVKNDDKIEHILCGFDHNFILTSKGKMMSCGMNFFG